MAKTARKKPTNIRDAASNGSQSAVDEETSQQSSEISSFTVSAIGIDSAVVDESMNENVEREENNPQSTVWKFATKISSDKARCNLCRLGKITTQILLG